MRKHRTDQWEPPLMPVPPLRPSSPSVSVVIPSGTTALPVLLAALPAVAEVIVVVGRDDDTTAVTTRATRVIRQTRTGVGNALACGVAASTGDIVVTLPGDGSCDPAELPRYLQALRDGADVVQGSRFHGEGRDLSGARTSRAVARIVLWFMAVLFGCRRSDPGSGFRAFWRDVAGAVGLPRVSGIDPVRGDGAEIEPLLTVRAGRNGLFVTEVPAVAYPPTAPAARAGLADSVWALLTEHFALRRAVREAETGSIVVLTGRKAEIAEPDVLGRTGTDAGLINSGPRPRAATAGHAGSAQPPAGPRTGTGSLPTGHWPASNPRHDSPERDRVTEPGLRRTSLDLDRRQGSRRPGGHVADEPERTPEDPAMMRRQWRDNGGANRAPGEARQRLQVRPNLRVINGEGSGSGSRTGRLRAVSPDDPHE
ncbi:glycosyltransferase [Actinoplanes regularis]|nr:glycosyltransferase [Actinoplanes regularis]